MILAQDLRLNNWVIRDNKFVNAKEHPYQIKWHDLGLRVTPFEPIIINHGVLLNCGARPFADGESLILNNRLIGYAECRKAYFDKATGIDFKYVHQMQNVHHAMTGEELEIKL